MKSLVIILSVGVALTIGCKGPEEQRQIEKAVEESTTTPPQEAATEGKKMTEPQELDLEPTVKEIVAEFVPVDIGVEDGAIKEELKPVIKQLVEAAKLIDRLFFNQVSDMNETLRIKLVNSPKEADTLALFDIMYGPWNRLDHNKIFYGDQEKPKGATFYPKDLTKEELEKWIAQNPDKKDEITGYFTVIRRDGRGKLIAVPYSEEYKDYLKPAAALLREAANLSKDDRLKKYLFSRADAFESNEYRESDMDWMDLGDGDLEVVIGPYEVYEDELMGYKAAYEAFITLRSASDSEKLARIKNLLPDMQAYLPLPDEHKKSNRGSHLPISVVDVLYTAGDTRAGVQTLAFNLPNDEVVREKKGFKLVLLKNISHAKYNNILVPIAKKLMKENQVQKISFDAFFNHTLVHETAHGLGPGRIEVTRAGKTVETTVNAELKELYPAIEETKADILGAYLNYLLVEKGLHGEEFTEHTYASLLAGFFRAMRFGTNEAHGKANLIQFNWLLDKGAVIFEEGKYSYISSKMHDAIKSLTEEVLMIEALGDYERAKKLIDEYGRMGADLKKMLSSIEGVPTDLRPSFKVEKQISIWK